MKIKTNVRAGTLVAGCTSRHGGILTIKPPVLAVA